MVIITSQGDNYDIIESMLNQAKTSLGIFVKIKASGMLVTIEAADGPDLR